MTGWTVLLALAVAGCVSTAVSVPARARLRELTLGVPGGGRPPGRPWWPMAAASVGAVGLWFLRPAVGIRLIGVLGGLVATAALVRHLVTTARSRRERRERQLAVIELCDALSAELRAGGPPERALERSCASRDEWSGISRTARLGGDVGAAMVRGSAEPGADGLRALAAGWRVASSTGAGLADVVERVATGLRADEDARAEVTASLGPPRATAKMLAVLPVFGLGLGSSMGADPVAFLLDTGFGLACLLLGLLLAGAGVLWVEKLAAAAEV
jgi:tight adherence protein B